MNKKQIFAGPTLGDSKDRILYALDAEESSMIKPESELSEKEKEIDTEYVMNNTTWALSMYAWSKPGDCFMLDDEYKKYPHIIGWLQKIYNRLGFKLTQNIVYAPPKKFAEQAVKIAELENYDVIASICFSFNSKDIYRTESYIEPNVKVNSKTSLFEFAEKFGFSVPKTVNTTIDSLNTILSKFNFPDKSIFLKFNGLGGGNSVKQIKTEDELNTIINSVSGSTEVMIQEKIGDEYLETISVGLSYPDKIVWWPTRVKMISETNWYGNIFLPDLNLNDTQKENLERIAKAVRENGYCHEKGLLVGFDGFIGKNELLITEINARYYGSCPPTQILTRLGLLGKVQAVSSFDYIHESDAERYMEFFEKHLYDNSKNEDFSVIPMGFSAYLEKNQRIVNYIVIGNFEAFCDAVKKEFSNESFIMVNNSKDIYIKTKNKLEKINKS